MQQARFWVWHNGLVRIKINAGQTLSHSSGGATDEGYSWEFNSYSFDGETVTSEWATQARDCDGRLDRSGECYCPADRLDCGYFDEAEKVRFPEWQEAGSRQRDYSAEAMGY